MSKIDLMFALVQFLTLLDKKRRPDLLRFTSKTAPRAEVVRDDFTNIFLHHFDSFSLKSRDHKHGVNDYESRYPLDVLMPLH